MTVGMSAPPIGMISKNSQIEEVLALKRDWPLCQHLLQFSERHHAGREREKAEQRFDDQRDHHHLGKSTLSQVLVILRGTDQSRR